MKARSLSTRLMLGGLPAVVSAGLAAVVPLTGALFLSQDAYATWALVTTLSTIFLLFDFGAPALATKLAAEGSLNRHALVGVISLTATPPLVLGALAAAIWYPYANASGLSAYEPAVVIASILIVAVGCALRSAASVFAAISLGRRHYANRAMILVAGALASAVATVWALWAGIGLLALGLGVIANGVVGIALSMVLERRLDESGVDVAVARLIRRFFISKGAATLLGLVITQLDRWALGLAGDASLLATYDLATRVIQIPKIALLALLVGLVAEAATTSGSALRRLWSRSTGLTVAVFVAAQVVCLPTALFLSASSGVRGYWPLVVGVAVAQLALTSTIPTTLILSGEGRPERELLYLVPTFLLVMGGYVSGVMLNNGVLLATVWLVSVTTTSLIYVLAGPKLIGTKDAV